ncbi:MAG: SIMPL domain-containing protein [Bacteroidetes bacterium]|nr:SIMPL domain-containing protein [Bacteroidota bacterium]
MKTTLFSAAFAFICIAAPSQNSSVNISTAPPEHTITVTGISEMDIVPDEIYVNVGIEEFTKDKKKFFIEELESGFLNFLDKSAATPATDVKMDYTDARIIAMKRKQKDAIISKTYEVKFKNSDQVTLLLIAEDSLHLNNVYIKRYSHSKLDDYKQQVRAKAMADANDKAVYMLAAIGQKKGAAIYVHEIFSDVVVMDGINDYGDNVFLEEDFLRMEDGRYFPSGAAGNSNGGYDKRMIYSAFDEDMQDYRGYSGSPIHKTIKLKYWVNVTFSLA